VQGLRRCEQRPSGFCGSPGASATDYYVTGFGGIPFDHLWQDHTGKNATRESDGLAFDDFASEAVGIQNVLG
jgi:hypothetical protein